MIRQKSLPRRPASPGPAKALNSPLRPRACLAPYKAHHEICRGDRRSVSKGCVGGLCLRALRDLRDQSCRPPKRKKMAPFDDPIHNIHTSYVGATYHVARNHKSKRQRVTGGQRRRAVSTRPTRPTRSDARPKKPVPPPPINPYAFFKDRVGATGGQCRRSVSTRPTRPIMSPEESAKMFRRCSDIPSDETCHVLNFRTTGQGVPPLPYTYCIYTVTQKGGKMRASSQHLRTHCASLSAHAGQSTLLKE